MTIPTAHLNHNNTSEGCGSGSCGCQSVDAAAIAIASINGIALQAPGESVDHETLRERAYSELLRQEAVRLGHLPPYTGLMAPTLLAEQQDIVDRMLETEVVSPQPTQEEAKRYYEAHQAQFTVGQERLVRHILFAVTPGVNVQALAQRAEAALLELSHKDVAPERFAQLAGELSNCPTGAQGGALGWLTPNDCAPEFAKELFYLQESSQGTGLRPRLVHTRFGFHLVDVLDVNPGHLPDFETLKAQIASRLQWQSRATALGQYMRRLVGLAHVTGIELDGDASSLVQ